MISLEHKFLFVHVPKTAGNSMQNLLRKYSEDNIVCLAPHQDGVERFEVRSDIYDIRKHSTLQEYRNELGRELFDQLFKFACVRNPWDRAISAYFSPHRGKVIWNKESFRQSLPKLPPVTCYLSLSPQEAGDKGPLGCIDHVIRFENLTEGYNRACELIGIESEPLPVRNKSKSKRDHYTAYYDDELIELVGQLFADEIKHFGYRFRNNC